MQLSSTSTRMMGHTIINHTLTLDECEAHKQLHGSSSRGQKQGRRVFAREIVADGNADAPMMVYLQGGPGFPSPRPTAIAGWLGHLTAKFRVLLLDQRGTGNSDRIEDGSEVSVDDLVACRADGIVADAEALREALGVDTWHLFGQSFGGFCITTYLSIAPQSVASARLTGGLPAVGVHIDDVYRATYRALKARHDEFFRQVPWAERRIREIIDHLDNSQELLPTGERLSSRRFRTIGIELGRGAGFATLAYLLEDPFTTRCGQRVMRSDVLADIGRRVSFAEAPLYAVLHEAIYADAGTGHGGATAWSAHRVREEFECFSEDHGTYLTGEHIYPWMFDEDPSLRSFAAHAEALARKDDWGVLYNPERLHEAEAVAAACVYVDDIFVPFEYSRATAGMYRDCRMHITNQYQHNGIAEDGAGILGRLAELIDDH